LYRIILENILKEMYASSMSKAQLPSKSY